MEVDGVAETHSRGGCMRSDKVRDSMDLKEEITSPSPRYTHVYMSKRKRKRLDHTDPFAVRDYVHSFDTPKYGSVTKIIEDLLASKEQMLRPFHRMYFSLAGADSMGLKREKELSSANYNKEHDHPSAQQLVVISDSDDDELTSQIPSKSCQDTIINTPSMPYEDTILKLPLSLDTPKYGSVTKIIEDLLASKEQMLKPVYRMCSSLDGADSMGLKREKEFSSANYNKEHDHPSAQQLVVISDSDDDDELTSQIPSKSYQDTIINTPSKAYEDTTLKLPLKPYEDALQKNPSKLCQDSVLNKPNEQLIEPFLEGDYAPDQQAPKGGKDTRNSKKHRVKKVRSLDVLYSKNDIEKKHDDMDSEKKHEDMKNKKQYGDVDTEKNHDDMDRKKKHDDMDGKKKHDDMGSNKKKGDDMDSKKKHDDMDNEKKLDEVDSEKNHGDMDSKKKHDDMDTEKKHDKGEYIGVEDDNSEAEVDFDGLGSIWEEMSIGLESSKDIIPPSHENENEDCDHTFILKDDIGSVCRVCGIIERSIESIIEYQRPKTWKSTRTYYNEGKSYKDDGSVPVLNEIKSPGYDFTVLELTTDPTHKKQMKPHQIEGFNFLLSNLVFDHNPGGCILAHAPGSGKTFMMISFIQSFMSKYPDARPLVIHPKGLLDTWKDEFTRWKVEIPLLDLYSTKSEGRAQQYQVLKKWKDQRSILLLGYQQFSSIVCDNNTSSISVACQDILLKGPSIVILDEGHTPRTKDTNILTSLEKIETPLKVVLSGTLYQNHVREVFNIFNLVRPRFLRTKDSKVIKRRILSRILMDSKKNLLKNSTDNEFYDVVEHTLQKDENFKRKVAVIEDLREMTSKVLHYYKGDSLDELPGLVDFSVFLNLTPTQKSQVKELQKLANKFKISPDGSALYVHPALKSVLKKAAKDKDDSVGKLDEVIENLDESEGVKAKFYLNLLELCESGGEKLLVFGQFLLPLQFLLKLTEKVKGWKLGKHMFMIKGANDKNERKTAIEKFNNSPDSKVFFASIKTCGEGISLVGASRIIILDIHLNPSVTRQAIGRAFRPGQIRKVYTYRLIAADSPEAEDHEICFKKESISKMWFEWNDYCGHHDYEMETMSVGDCGDRFLDNPLLNQDVTAVYKR